MLKKILSIILFGFVLLQANAIDLKLQCDENNATACYMYALPMISGKNAKVQDIKEKGMSFMRKACVLGYNKACDKIGENYYKDSSYIAAKPYLEESCSRGIKSACESMGVIYRDGHDIRQSDVKARKYFEKACNLGSGDACYNIAIMYRGGFGVEKSRTDEKIYYEKSCTKGLKAGCDRFTELDNEDKGIETGIFATIKAWFK